MKVSTVLSVSILSMGYMRESTVVGLLSGTPRINVDFDAIARQITKRDASTKPLSAPLINLIEEVSRVQSSHSRKRVETAIQELTQIADSRPAAFKKPVAPGAYRTVWSTVTSDSFFGQILRQTPSNVLGGPSWQLISPCRTKSENIVYWPKIGLRMAGLADLSLLQQTNKASNKKRTGYALTIKGLEFRWASDENNGLPEQLGIMGEQQRSSGQSIWEVIKLKDDEILSNGVGELQVLYNDGLVRIVLDSIQDNTYIHIKEPIPGSLDIFS